VSAAALDEAVYAASGIVKSFAGVRVLHGVDFTVRPGRIHGLFGHNGAGKSVMLKILSGADRPDGGSLRVGGEAVELASPHEALRQGIACVYQELRLIPQLTVAENLFLGRELRRHGFEDLEAMLAHTDRLLADYGLSIRASARVGDLSHPDKQIIEVIANLDRKARFLFLDEPTTALEGRQAAVLLGTVRRMVDERGIGAVLVSHKLDEVLGFCDDVTVMSGGRVMLRAARTEVTKQDIVAAIIGHAPAVAAGVVRRAVAGEGAPMLVAHGVTTSRLRGVTLTARAGEVLGVYGLAGAGRTRFCRALYGMETVTGGVVTLDGAPYAAASPAEAMRKGVAYLTEERKRDGFVPNMSGLRNTVLPVLRRFRRGWLVDHRRAHDEARGTLEKLRARGQLDGPIKALSGGNQQKVLFARVIEQGARLVLLDEPTKGVDIGAKADIYAIVRSLAQEGRCVVLVSSEEEEILEVADGVTVFRQGRCDGTVLPVSGLTVSELRRLAWS